MKSRSKSMSSVLALSALVFSLLWLKAASANVLGTDYQNFVPTTDGLDFVTVHSSQTLEPGILNGGFFLNYAVNSLPSYNDPSVPQTSFRDSLLSSDLNFGLGLGKNWDFGASFPMVLSQRVDNQGSRIAFTTGGLTEVRANTKYRFLGDSTGGVAVVASTNISTIQNNPFTGSNPGPSMNLELAGHTTVRDWAFGLNLGHRWRSSGPAIPSIPIEPFRNQYLFSAAASYLLKSIDTKLITEFYGSVPSQTVSYGADRRQSSGEVLFGGKYDMRENLALHAGVGAGIFSGVGSPDYRIYAGLNYVIGPLFSKHTEYSEPEPVAASSTASSEIPTQRVEGEALPGTIVLRGNKEVLVINDDILFEFDSDVLQGTSEQTILRIAKFVKHAGTINRLIVGGHTDSVGKEAYNQKLSQRRANRVREVLITTGEIPTKEVEARGFGSSQPIAENSSYQGRRANRRVEIEIFRKGK